MGGERSFDDDAWKGGKEGLSKGDFGAKVVYGCPKGCISTQAASTLCTPSPRLSDTRLSEPVLCVIAQADCTALVSLHLR